MRKLAFLAVASLGLASSAAAATLTVTSTADSGPGTLHQALLDSNASVGVLDTIAFAVPGAASTSIASHRPVYRDRPVIIDGTTQPGYAGSPLIELTESTVTQGFRISAGGSTVRGLAIFDFGTQLTLVSNGGNTVEACYIGINAAGSVAGNGQGLQIQSSPDTTIGGSVGSGNVISGLTANGIQVVTSDRTIIRGNLIGSDPTGMVELGNGGGISIGGSDDVVIGGTVAGEGNLVSGSSGNGIYVTGSEDTLIAGNLIGTDITGTHPMPNDFGLEIDNVPSTITIGGPAPAARNIISGNRTGIRLNSGVQGATIQNNYLGTDITGTLPLPNSLAILVNIQTATDVLIGGPNPGEGNLIVSNRAGTNPAHGILSYGQRITVRGNRIYDNQGLGFDIDPLGVNPNDPGDADGGANDGQNFPNVTSVEVLSVGDGIGTRVLGVLRSEASTQYTLDFYGNDGCTPRPQDFLEAQTYLGAGQVTTDGTGFTVIRHHRARRDRGWRLRLRDGDRSRREHLRVLAEAAVLDDPRLRRRRGRRRHHDPGHRLRGGRDGHDRRPAGRQPQHRQPDADHGHHPGARSRDRERPDGDEHRHHDRNPAQGVGRGFPGHSRLPHLQPVRRDSRAQRRHRGHRQRSLRRQRQHVEAADGRVPPARASTACATCRRPAPARSSATSPVRRRSARGSRTSPARGSPAVVAAGITARRTPCAATRWPCSCSRPNTVRRTSRRPAPAPSTTSTCPGAFAVDFIEQLAAENITGGCGTNPPLYCPLNNNTRGQMAVFVTKTFNLP